MRFPPVVAVAVRGALLYFGGILLALVIPALPFLNKQHPLVMLVAFAVYALLVLSLVFRGILSKSTSVLLVIYLVWCSWGRSYSNRSLHMSAETVAAVRAMNGSTALITGSSRGNGYHAAALLCRHGWTVIVHGRRPVSAAAARQRLLRASPRCDVRIAAGQLHSVRATRRFAREAARLARSDIHLLINNAGVNDAGGRTTRDGYDEVVQVNYLSGVLLSRLLMQLANTRRIVHVSSLSHTYAPPVDDQQQQIMTEFSRVIADPMANYGRSKALQIAWTHISHRRLVAAAAAAGEEAVHVVALHPGRCRGGTPSQAFKVLGGRFLLPPVLMRWYVARLWTHIAELSWNDESFCGEAAVNAAFQRHFGGRFLMQLRDVVQPAFATNERFLKQLEQATLQAIDVQ